MCSKSVINARTNFGSGSCPIYLESRPAPPQLNLFLTDDRLHLLQSKGFRFGPEVIITEYNRYLMVGKAVVEISVIKIPINNILKMGSVKPVLTFKALVIGIGLKTDIYDW